MAIDSIENYESFKAKIMNKNFIDYENKNLGSQELSMKLSKTGFLFEE